MDINSPIGADNTDKSGASTAREAGTSSEYVIVIGMKSTEEDMNDLTLYGEPQAGTIDITIGEPNIVLRGIHVDSDTISKSNDYSKSQKFRVRMKAKLYEYLQSNESPNDISTVLLYNVEASPVKSKTDDVDEVGAFDPVSPIGKIMNVFKGNKPSYAESYEEVNNNCVLNPSLTLAGHISKLKQRDPHKLRLIPPAAQVRQSRHNKNIYEGPVMEVNKSGIVMKTEEAKGITVEGGTTSLSGRVIQESNDYIRPQQYTGIPTKQASMEDFMPNGTIVTPRLNREPAIVTFIQALLPILRAVQLGFDTYKVLYGGNN